LKVAPELIVLKTKQKNGNMNSLFGLVGNETTAKRGGRKAGTGKEFERKEKKKKTERASTHGLDHPSLRTKRKRRMDLLSLVLPAHPFPSRREEKWRLLKKKKGGGGGK
jgi:hypothetical protein